MRTILLLIFLTVGSLGARAGERIEHVLGRADAPIAIIEYAALTCPHCAAFNQKIMPELTTRYLDTGKAKLIYRDFPIDRWALRAAVLARCVRPDRYFAVIDTLFRNQDDRTRAPDPMAALARIGKRAGLSVDRFDTCMHDGAMEDDVLAQMHDGQQQFAVDATPTLIANGRKIDNPQSFAEFDALLQKLAP